MQALGNLCITFAGFLYLLPVQHLLHELAHKRDDGGGVIAGIKLLVPLWALLLVGLLLATARGGFDWLALRRGVLYALVIAATLSLAFVTFASLVSLGRPTWMTRLTVGLPIYLVPPLTIALIAIILNTTPGSKAAIATIRMPWTVVAGLSLAGCIVALGHQGVRAASRPISQFVYSLGNNSEITAKHLAIVPTLDPQRDFIELVGYASSFYAESVRTLATARVRTHPHLIDAHVAELGEKNPWKALEFAARADFSPEELQRLAGPVRDGMFAVADNVHRELRYTPAKRLKHTQRWGRELNRTLAQRFASTGVDFAPALQAFEQAFIPDEN